MCCEEQLSHQPRSKGIRNQVVWDMLSHLVLQLWSANHDNLKMSAWVRTRKFIFYNSVGETGYCELKSHTSPHIKFAFPPQIQNIKHLILTIMGLSFRRLKRKCVILPRTEF